jgi:hypothetical protein
MAPKHIQMLPLYQALLEEAHEVAETTRQRVERLVDQFSLSERGTGAADCSHVIPNSADRASGVPTEGPLGPEVLHGQSNRLHRFPKRSHHR